MHTIGPWIVKPGGGRYKVMGNGMQIWSASVHVASVTNKADKPMDQKTADARLIAASPDLLAALEDIIARNEIQHWFNLDLARAAVAKAKG